MEMQVLPVRCHNSGPASFNIFGGTGAGRGAVNSNNVGAVFASDATQYGCGGGGGGSGSATPNNSVGANGFQGIVIVRYLK